MASYIETALASLSPQAALINTLREGPMPKHIGFIMDGNRRWAKGQGMPIAKGHYLGSRALLDTADTCFKLGITSITVYGFSLENFNRSKEQVQQLMALFKYLLVDYSRPGQIADRYNIEIRVVGRIDLLGEEVRRSIDIANERTGHNKGGVLNLCLAYGSRDEICRAMKETVRQCWTQKLPIESISAETIAAQIDVASDGPVDILVRTSSVYRFSDFLLWQCHQDTDIQVVDVHWPDFGLWQLCLVIMRWQRKQQGGLKPARTSGISFPLKLLSCIIMTVLLGLCVFERSSFGRSCAGWWLVGEARLPA